MLCMKCFGLDNVQLTKVKVSGLLMSETMHASGAWKNANAIARIVQNGNLARTCSNPIYGQNFVPVADVIWLTQIGLPFQLDVGTAVDCSASEK